MAPVFNIYDLTAIDSVHLALALVAVAFFVFLIFTRDTD